MTADQLFRIVTTWTKQTFGAQRSNRGILDKIIEEVDELAISVDNWEKFNGERIDLLNELADVQILLWDVAARNGVCFNELIDAVLVKHAVNRTREWKKVPGEDYYKHT